MCEFTIERLNVVGDIEYTETRNVSNNLPTYEPKRMEQDYYSVTYIYGVMSDRNKLSNCSCYMDPRISGRLTDQNRSGCKHSNFSKSRVHPRPTRKIPC